ncbi:MAG TPA: AAA family ATPase, partial [Limnochordales bacterium]
MAIPEEELTPQRIVEELDRYIVGQSAAKRAVAIALRNRYRRQKLPPPLRDEVTPKNILMIGPTGVGKTEIARRLARLVDAPFLKVEATQFTEVGYVGRDVESIIRDLVEVAVRAVRRQRAEAVQDQVAPLVEERLLDLLVPPPQPAGPHAPWLAMLGLSGRSGQASSEEHQREADEHRVRRERVRAQLRAGELEDILVEVEVEDRNLPWIEVFSPQGMEQLGVQLQDLLGQFLPRR